MSVQARLVAVRYFVLGVIGMAIGCQSVSRVIVRVQPNGTVEIQLASEDGGHASQSHSNSTGTSRPIPAWPDLPGGAEEARKDQSIFVLPRVSSQNGRR